MPPPQCDKPFLMSPVYVCGYQPHRPSF
jgi:hypothetical protein